MSSFFSLFAKGISISASEINYNGTTTDSAVLGNILNTVYLWAGIIAVIVLVVAGYFYVVSGDNPNQITRAKNTILGALIGLAIVLFAFIITYTVLEGV